jgi:hypothetical protein
VDTPEAEAKLLRLIPHGRVGETHDIAQATVWLASDLSDYVNGATLYVDGGMTLYPEFRGSRQEDRISDRGPRAWERDRSTGGDPEGEHGIPHPDPASKIKAWEPYAEAHEPLPCRPLPSPRAVRYTVFAAREIHGFATVSDLDKSVAF